MEEEVECCVCLQSFDENGEHVPRVLGCGHTLCQLCIHGLAQVHQEQDYQVQVEQRRYIVRCPECFHVTALVTPSSLPKNIELLRLSRRRACGGTRLVAPSSSVGEVKETLYGRFVASGPAHGAFSVKSWSSDRKLLFGEVRDGQLASQVSLLFLGHGRGERHRSVRKDLEVVLRLAAACHLSCRVWGLWQSDGDGKLFLVNNMPTTCSSTRIDDVATYLNQNKRATELLIESAINMCECILEVHARGMALGVFGTEMFHMGQEDFGPRVLLHWNALLHVRSVLHHHALAALDDKIQGWQYMSPELVRQLGEGRNEHDSEINCKTDVWSFACFLLHLFCQRECESLSFNQACQRESDSQQQELEVLIHSGEWILDSCHLHGFLHDCLTSEANQRPTMSQVWYQLKLLQSPPERVSRFPETRDISVCFALQGVMGNSEEEQVTDEVEEKGSEEDWQHLDETALPLEGHIDCITCLSVCGVYLVSTSFDKTIRVWHTHDGTLRCCWHGHHSQRILALAVDEMSQLCLTGDYGGSICAWKVSEPFENHPLLKWKEHDDWRFSGVSSLAVSPGGVLYSGSGDKTIKAWALSSKREYEHIATLRGHRALVSALAVHNGLLYSGSWDGCVGIWLCSDHSPIAIMDAASGAVRALAVSFHEDFDIVISSHDNGRIQTWKNGKCHSSFTVHDDVVSSLAIVGTTVITGSWDKSIKVWRMNDLLHVGEKQEAATMKNIGGEAPVMAIVCKDGKLYASMGEKIKVYSC